MTPASRRDGTKERIALAARRDGGAWRSRNDGARWPRHRHDEFELNLGLRGRITYLVDDRRVVVERDSLLALFPAQEHVVIEQSPDAEMLVAVWRPAVTRRLMTGARAAWARASDGSTQWRLAARRARTLAGVWMAAVASADDAAANACLAALLLAAWEAAAAVPAGEPGEAVHPAVEAAARRLRADPSLDGSALARAAGLSRARLSRLFRAQVGVPLSDYRARLRLERALDLLADGRGNLLEAALAAGFGSYAQFHRVVRARLGVSPRDLARRDGG